MFFDNGTIRCITEATKDSLGRLGDQDKSENTQVFEKPLEIAENPFCRILGTLHELAYIS